LVFLALILGAMCLPAASIYAWQRSQPSPEDAAVRKSLDYLLNSPTFRFDGLSDSVKVLGVMKDTTITTPFCIVTVEFECGHGGYGDRSGQMVTQFIQHHTAVIHVSEGRVTMAVIDGVWDELAGKFI
jgi:hypothetical protein